ncbi:AraC family transcriptional regulator [Siphonobacter sp. SORGH_AS_1065]|uniref:helix-turn-helix domain-containing protein n=1 Tax=Siphonobacter sp. SORGH_AS_1065 TaxID=3041795 RepID=UPI002787C651|nr:AraC family transcriptional regulator [Siphonobacter sp. SORGH_AS_1065]MDQ1090541.1 AraC-like DNA-binding protein [Siphonobacter sp. SORGH_AS_1065]
MHSSYDSQPMLQLAAKLGVSDSDQLGGLTDLEFQEMRIVDFLPEMMIMIRSLISKEEFTYERKPITIIEKGLFISFQNIFKGALEQGADPNNRLPQERPHVRITPSRIASKVSFPKRSHIRQVTILIEMSYLQQFLGKDQSRFSHLFEAENTFWIEEFMSPEIAILVDEIVTATPEGALLDAYYRLKSLNLLYFLFKNLGYRQASPYRSMSTAEMEAIYRVRNAMSASLDQALPIAELVKLSGMNELKLRKLFKQVFGKGLYDYFQHLRMQEAARLLKEERLSVSETGYRLGFTNLSHFGRLFEECIGMKPKKWASQNEHV